MANTDQQKHTNRKRLLFAVALLAVPAMFLWVYLAPGPITEPSFESLQQEQRQTQKPPIDELLEMWKAAPGHGPIALELAHLYYAAGMYEKAIEFYREFLKSDTTAEGWLVRLDVSRSLAALGRDEDAIKELREILREHPGNAGALYNVGAIEANRGNPDAARASWNELIKLHPQDTLAIYARNALPKLLPVPHP